MAVVRGFAFTAEDRLRATVIERLMCDRTVDLLAAATAYRIPDMDFGCERSVLAELAEEGLVHISGTSITMPEIMRPFVRRVAAVFDVSQTPMVAHALTV